MHVYTVHTRKHDLVYSWDWFSQASHGPQYAFREIKWHKHNLQDFPLRHWSLNILNSCAKVSVVVIYKHAQRDLLFDKRSRSKCHLTECFWELPWSSAFVTMETVKLCFLWEEKKGGQLDLQGRLATMNSTIQHSISPLFLPFSFPCIYLNVFSELLCLLFCLSARLWFLTQRNSDTTINTSLQLCCPRERERETNRAPGWLEFQQFKRHEASRQE